MRVVSPNGRRRTVVVLALSSWLLAGATGVHAGEPLNSPWAALQQQSRQALLDLVQQRDAVVDGPAEPLAMPRLIVVGFTGGLERRDSRVSGVARIGRKIADTVGDSSDAVALVYSNFAWRQAARDVVQLVRAPQAVPPLAATPLPVILAYGHSWGGGAITKFARALDREGLEVALVVFIDAFTLRNPRVPANVRHAVNVYQRTGLLRGLPLRGRRSLVPESPEQTVILANLRITPETEHFGWNWNLVQPLLYRHHHRIGHDVRIERFLLDQVSLAARPIGPRD